MRVQQGSVCAANAAMQIISVQKDSIRGISSGQSSKQLRLLSLYNEAPETELTLDEFELFALDRLNLMRKVTELKNRGFEGEEFDSKLKAVRPKPSPTPIVVAIAYASNLTLPSLHLRAHSYTPHPP